MKIIISVCLATTFIFFCPLLSKSQENNISISDKSNKPLGQRNQQSTLNYSDGLPGKSLWGEINAGYANHGPAGSMTLNYRTGTLLFSTQFNKSHTCIDNKSTSEYLNNKTNTESHLTVESIAVLAGVIWPGKWNLDFTLGISWTHFTYMSTPENEHDFTLPNIWASIINRDYLDERLSKSTLNTIGIPAGVKLHFAPKHFVGLDAGIKADINMQSTTVSAELGIRLGRVITKRNSMN